MTTTTDRITPEVGIHENIDFETYLRWDALSQSGIKRILDSPKKWKFGKPLETTDEMRMGQLLHTCQLEPGKLEDRYAVMPAFERMVKTKEGKTPRNPRNTSEYRELVEQWLDEHADQETVTQKWLDSAKGMMQSLALDDRCREYLQTGKKEVSLAWRDEESGELLKACVDNWQPGVRITDLKSTSDPLVRFVWSIWKYGYDFQGAWYSDGIFALTGQPHEFCIAAVEKEKPFECAAAPLSERTLAQGRLAYRRAIRLKQQCEARGEWPGFAAPEAWELPEEKQQTILKISGESVAI